MLEVRVEFLFLPASNVFLLPIPDQGATLFLQSSSGNDRQGNWKLHCSHFMKTFRVIISYSYFMIFSMLC